jgi:hypothetical protein
VKKLIVILTVYFFIIAFSHIACASVVGSWYVQGSVTTKVSAKGHKAKTMKTNMNDVWTFNSDGNFEAADIGGTWNQTGKKVIVNLNAEDISKNFEDMLSHGLDTDITVEEVTKMTCTGTEQKNRTVSGTFKINMNIYSSEQDVHGQAQVTGSFKGVLLQTPTTDISGYWKAYHTEKGSGETGPDYFSLSQSGNSITGTFISRTGNNFGEEYDISGAISGASISMIIYQDIEVSIIGSVSNDAMNGTYKAPKTRPGTWRAERTASIPSF